MKLELWQQRLLSKIKKTDFEENKERICAEFRKLCEPFVGYKDSTFEGNSLRVNNDIYTLQVDTNDIIIKYSKDGANPIESKCSLKGKYSRMTINYYISGELDSSSTVGDSANYSLDYEDILNKLMRMIIGV